MLHGRRLDNALEHVNGSRYALVHAVAKRARQITLWLTADPAELRAEAAPPPMASETMSRDPVALAESEILDGEVIVHWDPDGLVDERELPDTTIIETDPLLLEGLDGDDDEDELDVDDESDTLTPALAQAIEGAAAEVEEVTDEADVEDVDEVAEADLDDEEGPAAILGEDEIEEISLEEVDEGDEGDEEDEPES
jgi:DNA-directed RNA polymerase subunit K/omega